MGAVLVLPLLAGLAGFVGGVISAVVYNLLAAVVGGIEFHFEHAPDDATE